MVGKGQYSTRIVSWLTGALPSKLQVSLVKLERYHRRWSAIHTFRGSPLLCLDSESRSVVSDSLRPHGQYSPWNSPGQNTGVGCRSPLQGIFPTQGSNLGLLHCRQILYQLSHQGSHKLVEIAILLKSLETIVLGVCLNYIYPKQKRLFL